MKHGLGGCLLKEIVAGSVVDINLNIILRPFVNNVCMRFVL
jgi:hypothetical protein